MRTYNVLPDNGGNLHINESPQGEWVPADVAQGLYDALIQARSELEEIALAEIGERYLNFDINAALAAADGEEV